MKTWDTEITTASTRPAVWVQKNNRWSNKQSSKKTKENHKGNKRYGAVSLFKKNNNINYDGNKTIYNTLKANEKVANLSLMGKDCMKNNTSFDSTFYSGLNKLINSERLKYNLSQKSKINFINPELESARIERDCNNVQSNYSDISKYITKRAEQKRNNNIEYRALSLNNNSIDLSTIESPKPETNK